MNGKNYILKPLALFLLSLAHSTLIGQSYSFKNYTTHDGLVQTDITAITQDKKGNIWIGTHGGISIFDGKKFTNYDDHDLLQSLHITALLCDSLGRMWIATRNGLLKYEARFESVYKPNANHDNAVTCLTTNSQNDLLFVCNGQIYKVTDNQVEEYCINNNTENNIALIAFDREDNLWIVKNDLSIYKKNGASLTSIGTPFSTGKKKQGLGIIKILGKEGPAPYFVTNFGTFWVKDDSLNYFVTQYPQFAKAKTGLATYVLEEDDSTIWVGGTVGLSKIGGSSAKRFAKNNGFCDNSVSCLFTDREHNLWIGCTYNGVFKLSNEALFHLATPDESVSLQHISDVVPLGVGTTLVSTWGKGLFLYRDDSVSRIRFPSPRVNYITSMLTVAGYTYVATFGDRLWKMNNSTFAMAPVPGFAKDEAVYHMFKVNGGLLFHMLDESVYITDYSLKINSAIKQPEDYTIAVVKDKIYQMSPFGQVTILDNNLQPVKKNLFPEISSRITQLICYHDNFLVGTFGQGLFIYNQSGKLVKRMDKKSGLNTNIITSLLIDGNHLFIGSNLGLLRAELPDLHAIKIFNEAGGMFNWECRQGGLKKLANGSLLIATTNGPYIYYPAKDMDGQYMSGVLTIADFAYGQNSEKHYPVSALGPSIQLPEAIDYKDNGVTITLNGVSQRNPGGILYQYQLAGYDSMWVTTANPVIALSGLAPGDYKLKAYISVGNFVSKPVFLRFSIARPLSGRLWFQVLLILVLSVLCWALFTIGNRIYQKYIQTKMVGKLESAIALKQQLTARSVSFAQHNYNELSDALKTTSKQKPPDDLAPLYLKDITRRIELLWRQDTLSLGAFHGYFDELLSEYAPGAKVYHKLSAEEAELPMPAAFHLLQVFSLYLFIGLYENAAAVFSLDSENKSSGRLLLRFYSVTHLAPPGTTSAYHFLKEAIDRQRPEGVTIDVIENLELGNTLLAELNLREDQS